MKSHRRRVPLLILVVGLAVIALGSCTVIMSSPSYIQISNTGAGYPPLSGVYITPSSNSQSWGSNLLAPNYIYAGGSSAFTVNPDTYDVMVTDTSNYTAKQYSITVTTGNTIVLYYNGITLTQ